MITPPLPLPEMCAAMMTTDELAHRFDQIKRLDTLVLKNTFFSIVFPIDSRHRKTAKACRMRRADHLAAIEAGK